MCKLKARIVVGTRLIDFKSVSAAFALVPYVLCLDGFDQTWDGFHSKLANH